MQSLAVYGRLLARVIVAGINNEFQPWATNSTSAHAHATSNIRELHLVTALSGISKTLSSSSQTAKKWSFGDDACFVARHKLADVIGVADGVGGWRQYGIDPSLFPKSLMSTCERMVKEGRFLPQNPAGVISSSYFEVLENKAPLIGSCTACVVALHHEKKQLYTANLGDSGFRVVREGQIVHRSEEQQHYFNTPFQLAVGPPTMEGLLLADSPESAQTTSFNMQKGDLILVGTDGLFDNMTDNMLLQHLNKLKVKDYSQESLQHTAHVLAQEAHKLAFDEDYMSPFADNAYAHGIDIKGGKPDDITVVLSKVALGEFIT